MPNVGCGGCAISSVCGRPPPAKAATAAAKRPGSARRSGARNFTTDQPNAVWVTDITEHPTGEGKLYCCLIKDLFSNRIVGYSINERMTKHLAVDRAHRQRAELSDRTPPVRRHRDRSLRQGCQFRSRDFVAVLKAAGLSGSMGRVAAAGDNAAMESFNSLLQKNVLNRQQWKTRDDLRYAIIHWIEHTYNGRRRQRRLGRLTPVEFELAFTHEAA
ncbi:MAG: IS3 family transposase [Acidimicrobiaceae bacterium]|nr:IS3 family transposase [Acidimicrobiaceae bacterium]